MRSNQDVTSSHNRPISAPMGVTGMPLEWLDARSWRLPSGKALAEFALQAGFLAPLLFRSEKPRQSEMPQGTAFRSKSLGKGVSR